MRCSMFSTAFSGLAQELVGILLWFQESLAWNYLFLGGDTYEKCAAGGWELQQPPRAKKNI